MAQLTKKEWLYIGAGFTSLLFIKYIVLGLDDWNSLYHKERLEIDSKSQPLAFRQGIIITANDIERLKIFPK